MTDRPSGAVRGPAWVELRLLAGRSAPQSPLERIEAAIPRRGYWSTKGSIIVDGSGRPVRIAGVNWFGFETAAFAPEGWRCGAIKVYFAKWQHARQSR